MAEGTWIDAFVTKPLKDEADAVFLGSVMSGIPANNGSTFKIKDETTHWVTPRWLNGNSNYYASTNTVPWPLPKYKDLFNLKKGDLIYIGHNLGATQVRTVLERKTFDILKNTTGVTMTTSRESAQTGELMSDKAANSDGGFVAYRVDTPINATGLPTAGGTYTPTTDQDLSNGDEVPATLENQHLYKFHDDSMQDPDRPDANAWCPMYKLNNVHLDDRLILPLNHGVKALHCVKLIAYSSNNKSLPGYLHFHEFEHDDYVMLGIKELPASLLSNESTARGAFAALHISDTGETYEREPAGIATQYVNPGASNVRQLTLELTNRKGVPAHLGRLHLWFKLLVTHG